MSSFFSFFDEVSHVSFTMSKRRLSMRSGSTSVTAFSESSCSSGSPRLASRLGRPSSFERSHELCPVDEEVDDRLRMFEEAVAGMRP